MAGFCIEAAVVARSRSRRWIDDGEGDDAIGSVRTGVSCLIGQQRPGSYNGITRGGY
jgi:hypothetical protein